MHRHFRHRVLPSLELMDAESAREIHLAALRILQRTGVVVHLDEVVERLRSAGCSVTDGHLVRIPAHLVESAVRAAPQSVNIYDRGGEPAMCLEERKSYWGTGSDTPFVYDPFTERKRRSCLDDVRKTSLLVDALPNYDFLMCMGVAHELPQTVADKHHFAEKIAAARIARVAVNQAYDCASC